MGTTQVRYAAAALPGNAETVVFFDTTISLNVVSPSATTSMGKVLIDSAAKRALSTGYAMPKGFFSSMGIKRFLLRLVNDQSGTLNAYRSDDRGAAWTKIYTVAVAASAANSENVHDVLVEGFPDFKLEWVNGATPQTTFKVSMEMVDERGLAA